MEGSVLSAYRVCGLYKGLKVEWGVEIAARGTGAAAAEGVHADGDCVVWGRADGAARMCIAAL